MWSSNSFWWGRGRQSGSAVRLALSALSRRRVLLAPGGSGRKARTRLTDACINLRVYTQVTNTVDVVSCHVHTVVSSILGHRASDSEHVWARAVVTLRYVTLRYVTLRYVTVPLGEGYVRPLCSPGDAIYARSSPARPGRRGVTRRRLQGSCTVLQQPGAQGDTLFRLWWLDHSPIFSLAARRAPSWQVRLGLRYVT